jgi:hypothetical protein
VAYPPRFLPAFRQLTSRRRALTPSELPSMVRYSTRLSLFDRSQPRARPALTSAHPSTHPSADALPRRHVIHDAFSVGRRHANSPSERRRRFSFVTQISFGWACGERAEAEVFRVPRGCHRRRRTSRGRSIYDRRLTCGASVRECGRTRKNEHPGSRRTGVRARQHGAVFQPVERRRNLLISPRIA